MSGTGRPRVLLAVTVYNGGTIVHDCLKSAKGLDQTRAQIDVVALDDASPELGFSRELSEVCKGLGVSYYRTPRNLGIVRNVNLGLLTGVEQGYDFVIISNSDVLYSRQTVDHLLEVAELDPKIGSVTAWSNNVSIYSIPNQNPDQHLAEQEKVDWIAASLAGDFRRTAIDIPAGISFCMLFPTSVVRKVGLMDPVFGRGYCEETDWSLRSIAMGLRLVLAPAAFVYHRGRVSTLAAGMVSGAHTTVPAHEAIIDHRYPLFRSQVDAFVHGGILKRLHRDAAARIVRDAGVQFGYHVSVGDFEPDRVKNYVRVDWANGGGAPRLSASFLGFDCEIPCGNRQPLEAARAFFGIEPAAVGRVPERPLQPAYPAHV